MKIHTDDLIGPALDWAVIYAEVMQANGGKPVQARDLAAAAFKNGPASPSTDWSVGGPIIEREKLGVWYSQALEDEQGFEARTESFYAEDKDANYVCLGPTPLVAAMRCYVTSKLGNKIEIPEELK